MGGFFQLAALSLIQHARDTDSDNNPADAARCVCHLFLNLRGGAGGWESLAVQMFYPDLYNGAFVACPDPVDFHAYMTTDLYKDDNMFFRPGADKKVEQPAMRDYLMEDFLKTTGTPAHGVAYDGEVKYGPRAEHCWNGDPTKPNAY